MPFVASGLGGQIVYAPEATWGTTAIHDSSSLVQPLEFNSETLELKKTIVQGAGIHAGGQHYRSPRRVLTNYAVSGGITMDLPTRYLNNLLQVMLGSSTPLTEDGTTGAYKAVHTVGSLTGHSLTIQKGVGAVDGTAANPFTYTGVKVTDWTISVATGQIATLALTVDGRSELGGSASIDPANPTVPTLATFAEAADNNVFHFREASLMTGTVAAGSNVVTGATTLGNVKSCEMKYAWSLDTTRYFLGSNGFKSEQIQNNWNNITGQFEIEWLTAENAYTAFANDTPMVLELNFTGAAIGTSGSDTSSLSILVPVAYLEGESPKTPGPAVVTQTVPFTGLDNGTGTPPIQVTYYTEDAPADEPPPA